MIEGRAEMADNIHEILIKLMWLCIIVGIGVVCTLIMLRIARKAIKKADRDPLLEFFFVNMIKVVMVFVIVGISLEKLSILHPSHFITLLGIVGAAIANIFELFDPFVPPGDHLL